MSRAHERGTILPQLNRKLSFRKLQVVPSPDRGDNVSVLGFLVREFSSAQLSAA